jgi:hypothetical protein
VRKFSAGRSFHGWKIQQPPNHMWQMVSLDVTCFTETSSWPVLRAFDRSTCL